MEITLHEAIQSLRPGIGFSMIADNPASIIWDIEETETPSDSEIELALKKLKAEKASHDARIEAARISRREKLMALGLTEEELDA